MPGYRVVTPSEFVWITRPHSAGEPARHVAELSEVAGFADVRANVWRYEPGAHGKRHRHPVQEETFVVLAGRRLAALRSHTFCLVVAGIECFFMPFGTILGVFTILTLLKPEAKRLFGVEEPAPTSRDL